ncbi:hypothetical protein TNCV_8201 [Trichonephila clavipes]|nr:hypothetical protein TNCV_8201 [Trichonephila clavipes]
MKTSSVEFISRSPNPLPMKSKHRSVCVAPEGSFSPGSGNEGKREIVLNRRPELYRGKYRCVQPKINLLKKTFSCLPCLFRFFLYVSDSPLVSMEIPLRTAYGQNSRCGMQPKAEAVFARMAQQQIKTKTKNFWTLEQRERERKENARGARAGVLPSEYHRQTYL